MDKNKNNLIYYELTINEKEVISHLDLKYFHVQKGIQKDVKGNNYCLRCNNKKLIIYNEHIYCDNCLEFNKVSNNTLFYQMKKSSRSFPYTDKLAEIKLSPKQLICSKFIYSTHIMKEDCLVHAVCGAGKTEITFHTISHNLKLNNYVCFAIPRIDILYEIAQRLKYFFPKTNICILNGNEKKVQHGQLYVMTTNQILRFKNAFSLIIVDEIDAFPYEYNFKYDYGVNSAKTKDGSIVYLTSTPSKNFLEKELPKYVINRRWHGYLLPVPIFKYFNINNFIKYGNKEFIMLLNSYKNSRRQLLLFISNIKLGYKFLNKLEEYKINIPFVYANSKNRFENIQAFSKENIKILLSTTILERGVTFKDIDVIILDSSNPLYNEASLIQIAGRSRRKIEYQKGEVYFYYEYKTQLMIQAKKAIENLNK